MNAAFRGRPVGLTAGAGTESMEDIREFFRAMIGGFVDRGLEGGLDGQPPISSTRRDSRDHPYDQYH